MYVKGGVPGAGGIMGQFASTFALVGGVFAVVDCFAESMRGARLHQGSARLCCYGIGVSHATPSSKRSGAACQVRGPLPSM